jgi:sigma-B regulation protein RsbU (phosphoserine phosphatase)
MHKVFLIQDPAFPDLSDTLRLINFPFETSQDATAQGWQQAEAQLVLYPSTASLELSRQLKEGRASGGPAGVVYTTDPDLATRHIEEGATDFLVVPTNTVLLANRLRRVLEGSQGPTAADIERQLIERDVMIGRQIQLSFLPTQLPQYEGWDLAAFFQPAREVAGDFYDAFDLLNRRRVALVIADVCDKGVPAAIFMALFRSLVRAGAQQNISLSWTGSKGLSGDQGFLSGNKEDRRKALPRIGTSALLNAVTGTNNYITENHLEAGYFATMFMAILDPSNGDLLYINGGHNSPMIVRADGRIDRLKSTGPAVGMLPGVEFRLGQAQLEVGDLLYLFTDGVPEAKGPTGGFFHEDVLAQLIGSLPRGMAAQEVLGRVKAALDEHMGNALQFDDITMMAVVRQSEIATEAL